MEEYSRRKYGSIDILRLVVQLPKHRQPLSALRRRRYLADSAASETDNDDVLAPAPKVDTEVTKSSGLSNELLMTMMECP